MIYDYEKVNGNQFETFENRPRHQRGKSASNLKNPPRYEDSNGKNTASYGIIKQQRDDNEEYPPHNSRNGSMKKGLYRDNHLEDRTNRNH
jgi:hypothetical protein